jgi:hypothetical protein
MSLGIAVGGLQIPEVKDQGWGIVEAIARYPPPQLSTRGKGIVKCKSRCPQATAECRRFAMDDGIEPLSPHDTGTSTLVMINALVALVGF